VTGSVRDTNGSGRDKGGSCFYKTCMTAKASRVRSRCYSNSKRTPRGGLQNDDANRPLYA
jgi:hypothetical protein